MTTRNKRNLAALNKENCEEHPRSNLAQNSNALRSQEDYITQVSEEIEGRVTKRLSKELSRTENRILCALARLDDFLMNPLPQGHSGTTPEPSRNALSTSQGTNEDDSQSDPHPEAGLFYSQITQNSGPAEGHDSRFMTSRLPLLQTVAKYLFLHSRHVHLPEICVRGCNYASLQVCLIFGHIFWSGDVISESLLSLYPFFFRFFFVRC